MNFCTLCLATLTSTPAGERADREQTGTSPALGIVLLVVSTLTLAGLFTALGLLLATFRQRF